MPVAMLTSSLEPGPPLRAPTSRRGAGLVAVSALRHAGGRVSTFRTTLGLVASRGCQYARAATVNRPVHRAPCHTARREGEAELGGVITTEESFCCISRD